MKTILFLSLALIATSFSCKKDSNSEKESYNYMHFVRQGGGQINFSLYPTENVDQVKVVVLEFSFRDTFLQFNIDKNSESASAFSLLQEAINNRMQINGDFRQSTAPTGTWSYIYLVADDQETEVTNAKLRNSLAEFETLVKNKIE